MLIIILSNVSYTNWSCSLYTVLFRLPGTWKILLVNGTFLLCLLLGVSTQCVFLREDISTSNTYNKLLL